MMAVFADGLMPWPKHFCLKTAGRLWHPIYRFICDRRQVDGREPGCAGEGSQLASRATAWSPAKGLGDGDGSLSEPLDGFIFFEDCASVKSDEQTSTKPFFRLPALSSVGGTSRGFVRRS